MPIESTARANSSNKRKTIAAWCCYDWANSGYTTLLITVFVVYIQRIVFANQDTTGAVVWAWCIAVSMLVGALLSPFLGALADAYGGKRFALTTAAFGGGVCCILIGLLPANQVWLIVALLVIANLGLELSLTFYNGFLPEIAEESEFNKVSAIGYSVGYFGGGIALLAATLFLWLNQSLDLATRLRICIVGTGIWWILFTIPVLCVLRDRNPERKDSNWLKTCRSSIQDTITTFSQFRKQRVLFWFLVAFLIYNDGVQTVLSQASTFALHELQFSEKNLAAVVLMIQFVATPGAIIVGWIADKLGRKLVLAGCLLIWILLLHAAWFVDDSWEFWVLAVGVALVMGGTQSISRAIMSTLTPEGQEARYFGFFNLSGKATCFLGTFFFGAVVALSGSSRLAIVGLLLFFMVGLFIIVRLRIE